MIREAWFGSIGPILYDDDKSYPDGTPHLGIYAESGKITGTPINGSDIVNKDYVDGGHNPTLIDRGDPSAFDFTLTGLTVDAAWHALSLASIIPSGALAAVVRIGIQNNTPGEAVHLRKYGNSNGINIGSAVAQVSGVNMFSECLVYCDTNRQIEYYITAGGTWAAVDIVVKAWLI